MTQSEERDELNIGKLVKACERIIGTRIHLKYLTELYKTVDVDGEPLEIGDLQVGSKNFDNESDPPVVLNILAGMLYSKDKTAKSIHMSHDNEVTIIYIKTI